jgi:hypothetical protein
MTTIAEEAFWNLVAAARAESGIAAEERRVLNACVLKLGLEPSRAREIQAAAEAENPPRIRVPKDAQGRLDTLRAVLEVAAADGTIAPKELNVVRALAGRCGIPTETLDRLLAVALRRSPHKLDQAFAALKPAADPGPELMEVGPPPTGGTPASRELLRSMPFGARLAPRIRICELCRRPFGDRDPYAQYCRPCVLNVGVRNLTAGKIETLAGLLFLLFLGPAAFLVQKITGLWSWGYDAMRAGDAHLNYAYSRRRGSSLYLLAPAAGVTALLAWLAAWGISTLITAPLRKR